MNGLKSFFAYTCRTLCGIKSVHFEGTDKDWELLLAKVKDIRTIITSESWSSYITGMEDLITKFIATRQGKFALEWWRKVVDIEHVGRGSGSRSFYSGWILQLFYSTFQKSKVESPPSPPLFSVPVKLETDGKTYPMIVKGGIVGINYDKVKNLYTPISGLGVFSGEKE